MLSTEFVRPSSKILACSSHSFTQEVSKNSCFRELRYIISAYNCSKNNSYSFYQKLRWYNIPPTANVQDRR